MINPEILLTNVDIADQKDLKFLRRLCRLRTGEFMAEFKQSAHAENAWIHELARAEVHPEAEKFLQLGKSFDPQMLVEESTIEFLTKLRDYFTEFSKILNGYSEAGTRFHEVKIYSIAQTPADFMVFRNQVKLLFSNVSHGAIQIGFSRHVRSTYSVDGSLTDDARKPNEFGEPQEIIAQIGAFRDVFWTYQDEKVQPDQVAKFYFAEFVRTTRNVEPSRMGNQLLLDEIKNFLQDKGINI